MEVKWTSGSSSGTKEIITQTRLNEKVQMKPSLKYTKLQETQIETDRQMLAIKETTQPEKRMSAKELIDAPVTQTQLQRSGNIPVNSLDANGNFVMPPYQYNSNKVLGTVTYYVFDHLGNTRVTYKPNVNCNGGAVSYTLESVIDLYPYSKILREFRAVVQEKYISTGNERDIETGYDNRNARSSDADNGRFNQMDKLAHLRPEWSPYRYGFCNPVNFGDPMGLYENNYSVDKEGEIKLEEKTDDNFDVLYTKESWDDGQKDNSITVEKGILDKMYSQSVKDPRDNTMVKYDVLKVRGDDKAKGLFEFLAKNTGVEWSRSIVGTKGNQGLNYITTSHLQGTDVGGGHLFSTQLSSYTFRGNDHSHDNNTSTASFKDVEFAKNIQKFHPNAKFNIYTPYNGNYIPFDKNSIPGLLPVFEIIEPK